MKYVLHSNVQTLTDTIRTFKYTFIGIFRFWAQTGRLPESEALKNPEHQHAMCFKNLVTLKLDLKQFQCLSSN